MSKLYIYLRTIHSTLKLSKPTVRDINRQLVQEVDLISRGTLDIKAVRHHKMP